jgi:hypothetical protein
MDSIFTLDDNAENTKVNLDELYEMKQKRDMYTLSVYNKILKRVHSKIRITSRQRNNMQCCWYVVPEMMIGVPSYDHTGCIAYLINELRDNGFIVRYTHPNLLFISWAHWMPAHVRDQFKKQTGTVIDGFGNEKVKKDDNVRQDEEPNDPNALLFGSASKTVSLKKDKKNFKDINTYKPSGGLIYNQDLLNKIENRLS